ncbi:GTP-binding protein [Nannocystis punicea]|uniref:Gliding-motility protein MglA n=1 Tax=Nannocystis punicea TaxID=2995304 RepID=A0ABY7HJ12_9BACT|nr:gliding-motility protein MglA [Nannocystis poenicansa]WAS99277.1 gliding-motility protein MglA [Nannocystis poenicansa]
MPFINHTAREINLKIVYWGAGLCGKTTNLQYIHSRIRPAHRGALLRLELETEPILFFDFIPQTLGDVDGYRLRFHLYCVPGPVFYDASRVLVLKGVDGLVFVADSQRAREEANVEMLEILQSDLAARGHDLARLPLVFQYNKRDVPDIFSPAELDDLLDVGDHPRVEAVAVQGVGVFDTLKASARQLVAELRRPA